VLLKDEADLRAQLDAGFFARVRKVADQDHQAAFLHSPQRSDEREQGRFAGARGTGHDHDFAPTDLQIIIEEDLRARNLGLIEQSHLRSLRPELTVRDNIALQLALGGMRRDQARRAADDCWLCPSEAGAGSTESSFLAA
jgi:hypothetical protein